MMTSRGKRRLSEVTEHVSNTDAQTGNNDDGSNQLGKGSACLECRKQKIKCQMINPDPPCVRCKKKGLQCMVNRNIQSLLKNDRTWKERMEERIERIEQTLGGPFDQRGLSPDDNLVPPIPLAESSMRSLSHPEKSAKGRDPQDWTVVIDLETGPDALPGHDRLCTAPTGRDSSRHRDFIDRGVITMESAERYFDVYRTLHDHFLYGTLVREDESATSISNLRTTSPGLATAVCAVGALYLASSDYDKLYKEFFGYCARLSFARKSTADDVRALCIAAFWFGDMSWTLNSTAIRIATELQLHKRFDKAVAGDYEYYMRIRLFLLVYVCDHHLSIPYGRPPMTRECEAVRDVSKLLDCRHARNDDIRLVSQVSRWRACSTIYDTFEISIQRPLSSIEISKMQHFNVKLDAIHTEWSNRIVPDSHVGNYPRKATGLQYHFAKLYLNSHALRGVMAGVHTGSTSREMSDTTDHVNTAIYSAKSILHTVVTDSDIRSYLKGLPTYFDTMITFAAVFLMKMSVRRFAYVQLEMQEVQNLLNSLVKILKDVTETMHPHHLLVRLTKGILEVLHWIGITPDSPKRPAVPPLDEELCRQFGMDQVDLNMLADVVFDQASLHDYDMLTLR